MIYPALIGAGPPPAPPSDFEFTAWFVAHRQLGGSHTLTQWELKHGPFPSFIEADRWMRHHAAERARGTVQYEVDYVKAGSDKWTVVRLPAKVDGFCYAEILSSLG